MNIFKDIFPMRSVKQWDQLPKDVVQSPSLVVMQLDKALSSLV